MKSQQVLGLTMGSFVINPQCADQVKLVQANIAKMRRIPKGKINEHMYAPFALMLQGKSNTSTIDHWNKHLLGAS